MEAMSAAIDQELPPLHRIVSKVKENQRREKQHGEGKIDKAGTGGAGDRNVNIIGNVANHDRGRIGDDAEISEEAETMLDPAIERRLYELKMKLMANQQLNDRPSSSSSSSSSSTPQVSSTPLASIAGGGSDSELDNNGKRVVVSENLVAEKLAYKDRVALLNKDHEMKVEAMTTMRNHHSTELYKILQMILDAKSGRSVRGI